MTARDGKPATEDTDAGQQTILHGVRSVTKRDQLELLAAAPMAPRATQKKCDHGLFDLDSRRQIDLVDELRRLNRAHKRQSNSKGE